MIATPLLPLHFHYAGFSPAADAFRPLVADITTYFDFDIFTLPFLIGHFSPPLFFAIIDGAYYFDR
jgi:hypothetical protein